MRSKISLWLCLLIGFSWLSTAQNTKKTETKNWHKPNSKVYDALWQSIQTSQKSKKAVQILHIGDSHITSGFTSAPIRNLLKSRYGDSVSLTHWGINGATFMTYSADTEIERIRAFRPDLLLVSLGTNDSYTFSFSADEMRGNVNTFLTLVQKQVPNLPIVLTTPPPSYLRRAHRVAVGRKRRRRVYRTTTSYSYNSNTQSAANTLDYVARIGGYGFIDLYDTIAGEREAKKWLDRGWMHSDRTHYTVAGYTKHGETIAEALVQMIESKK